ncbi:hypothetical protein D9615_006649 [Tricholomella constricta]|uniref:Uncharacterized protein n=1 Tax=Tricholomella constricta TaxID=117010 RepID=A0A8H5HA06_9AGAR|nr:hypothetical protein D9615_006649 [Tricholomella constricta]
MFVSYPMFPRSRRTRQSRASNGQPRHPSSVHIGSRTSPRSYNISTMISNILVALSIKSNIYQVPLELVRPCERYFTPMEHIFLNSNTGERERAIVLTYVPERAEFRKNTAFINLYVDIEEYPLYGRAGVARFLPEDPVPAAGSMDTLTPPSNLYTSCQAPLAQQERVEVLDEVQDAKAKLANVVANIQQGVDYDKEEETRRLLFSLVELEDMKLHVATMSANIQKLLPPDIRTLLEEFDRGTDIESFVIRGVDTNDLVVSQPPPSLAEVYVDKETGAADTNDLVVSQLPPSPTKVYVNKETGAADTNDLVVSQPPPSPAKVYVDKETDAVETNDLVVSQPPPSPAKVYVDKATGATDLQGRLQPAAAYIDTNNSLDYVETPAPAPTSAYRDIRGGARPSNSQASAPAPVPESKSKSYSYWDVKTHSPSVFVPWRPRPPSYYIYRSPTISPLRSSNASSASLAPIPPLMLTLSGTSDGTSYGDTLLDIDSDSDSNSNSNSDLGAADAALVPSLSFECGLSDCRTRHGPLLRAREGARWVAESKSQEAPPASLTVPVVPPARLGVEDAPEPVTVAVAVVEPLPVELYCGVVVVTGCASGQGWSQLGEEKEQEEMESVLEAATAIAIGSPSPSARLAAGVSRDVEGDDDGAAEKEITEYLETETDDDDKGDVEEEEEDASYGGDHDEVQDSDPDVLLHEGDNDEDGGVPGTYSEGDDEYESQGEDEEGPGVEDEEEGSAAEACDVEQVGTENSQLDMEAKANVEEAEVEDEEERGFAAEGACDVGQVKTEELQLDMEERASLVAEADVEDACVHILDLEPEEIKAFRETRPPDIAPSEDDPDPASVEHKYKSDSEMALGAEYVAPAAVNGDLVSKFEDEEAPIAEESQETLTEPPISAPNEGLAAEMGASSDDQPLAAEYVAPAAVSKFEEAPIAEESQETPTEPPISAPNEGLAAGIGASSEDQPLASEDMAMAPAAVYGDLVSKFEDEDEDEEAPIAEDPTEPPISANEGPAAGMGDLETLEGMVSLCLEDLLAIYREIELDTTEAHEYGHEHEHEHAHAHEHELYEMNSEGCDYSLIFEYVEGAEEVEEEEEEEADSHTASGDLAHSMDREADCLAERPDSKVEIQQAEKTDVVNDTHSPQDDDITTRAEDDAQAQAEDGVHVDDDDPDSLEVNNVFAVVLGLEVVVGTKLGKQVKDGVEADDAFTLHSGGLISNLEGELALDFSTSKMDDGVDNGGDTSPTTNTNREDDDSESLDERKRRSMIAQGIRREVLYEDDVPSTPKNNWHAHEREREHVHEHEHEHAHAHEHEHEHEHEHAHAHEHEHANEHEPYETNSEGRDYSSIFVEGAEEEEEKEEEADSHTASGDLAQSTDGEADCLAERPNLSVEIQQAEKADVVNDTYSRQDDMTTRTEEEAQAQAEDSVHVDDDNSDSLEIDNKVTVLLGVEEVVGTKLEEQAEDGVKAGDAYNLVSNIDEEPTDMKGALDSSTSKMDDGVDSGGETSPLTNREDDEKSLDERKRRSVIAQGKRREGLYEDEDDEVPSTPKNNRSRRPLDSPTSESAEHPTRTKKNLRGVSAIFGFTPTAPELLQRRESLTPITTDANRKHSPSRSLPCFRMLKLKGTGRLLNGAWKPSSGGNDSEAVSGSSPRKLKKMKPATTLWGNATAYGSPTPTPTPAPTATATSTAPEIARSPRKRVVFPSELWSSAAARELPAPEPAPSLSPGKKGAGVWGNAMRALRLPKEVTEPKKGAGISIAHDAKVNLALLMPKAVSAQIYYSRKR